jgi:hypothetical protein
MFQQKKTQRQIYSQNHWQSVHKSRPREDGCVVRSLNKRAIQRHFNCLRGPPVVGTPNATNEGIMAEGRCGAEEFNDFLQ